MDPTQPQSAAMIALLPCVVAIFWGARAAARRATLDPMLARLMVPAIAVAAWMLPVHVLGLVTHSFTYGLGRGTFVAGLAGAALVWSNRGRRFEATPPLPLSLWIPAIGATLLLAPAALRWSFHDELWNAGHQAIAAQIQNGIYPPRHGVFPAYVLRYHYGFDLLVAMVGSLTRLSLERSVDAVTMAGWFYSACLTWSVGERLVATGRGWIVMFAVLFAGPFAWFSTTLGEPVGLHRWIGLVSVGSALLNPSIASYFFQHPWSIGIPLALATLCLGLDRRPGQMVWRAGLLFAVLLCLSICHVVMFAALLALFAVVQCGMNWRQAPRRAAAQIVFALTTLAVASRLGGFFAAGPQIGTGIEFQPWSQTGHLGSNLLWDLGSFGWTLPLGIVGIALLLRREAAWGVVLAGLSAGGILIMNLVRYSYSWDIVKFGTAALLALAIASGVAIGRLWGASSRAGRRPLALMLLFFVASPGVGFLACFAASPPGFPRLFFRQPPPVGADHMQAIAWLRRHVHAGDLLYGPPELAPRYAQLGGLPQLDIDDATTNFGFPTQLVESRRQITSQVPANPGVYRSAGVRWIVAPEQNGFLPDTLLTEWRQRGWITPAQHFGAVTLYEIRASP